MCKANAFANLCATCYAVIFENCHAETVNSHAACVGNMIDFLLGNTANVPSGSRTQTTIPENKFTGCAVTSLVILHVIRTRGIFIIVIVLATDVKLSAAKVACKYAFFLFFCIVNRLGIGVAFGFAEIYVRTYVAECVIHSAACVACALIREFCNLPDELVVVCLEGFPTADVAAVRSNPCKIAIVHVGECCVSGLDVVIAAVFNLNLSFGSINLLLCSIEVVESFLKLGIAHCTIVRKHILIGFIEFVVNILVHKTGIGTNTIVAFDGCSEVVEQVFDGILRRC